MHKWAAAIGVLFAVSILPAAHGGTIWHEQGDAGRFPFDAQITYGSGGLDEIRGRLVAENGVDLYWIRIIDPLGFSARTTLNGLNHALSDPQLFLFDAFGYGVEGNDDRGDGNWMSYLRAGNRFSPTMPGLYMLGITSYDNDPRSGSGRIFRDGDAGRIAGPNGPGGASPLSGWTGGGGDTGAYRIILTGADSAIAPEPGSIALLGIGLIVLPCLRRRFSR